MDTMRRIKEYEKELTITLNKFSVSELEKFMIKNKDVLAEGFVNAFFNADETVKKMTLCKMCVHKKGVFPKLKKQAKNWLLENGFQTV